MADEKKIKVTGTPVTYGDGATRCTKEGKGRYDLIPIGPMMYLRTAIDGLCRAYGFIPDNVKMNVDPMIYCPSRLEAFALIIENPDNTMVLAHAMLEMILIYEGIKDPSEIRNNLTFWCRTIDKLAHHFENGAKIYGEHNCEKGIPAWSFKDSCLRHMLQWYTGQEDEDHYIAAIWNLWMLMWTNINDQKNMTTLWNMYQQWDPPAQQPVYYNPCPVHNQTAYNFNTPGREYISPDSPMINRTPVFQTPSSGLDQLFSRPGEIPDISKPLTPNPFQVSPPPSDEINWDEVLRIVNAANNATSDSGDDK